MAFLLDPKKAKGILYDRSYMRQEEFKQDIPALKWIIIVNLAVFVLAQASFHWFGSLFLYEAFLLSWENIRSGFLWTLGTYSILHGNFAHILFNMVVIFFFGRSLQEQIGGHKLLELYLVAVFLGAFMWLPFNISFRSEVVGASAGAMGLITVFCLRHFNQRITILLFFILPLTLTGKQMLVFFLSWEAAGFVLFEMGPLTNFWPFFFKGVAYSAHLGGMVGGYLFYRYLSNRESWWQGKRPLIEIPKWVKKRSKGSTDSRHFQVNISSRKDLKSEVDRILDKINSEGFGSLSDEEKRTLDKAKDLLSH